MWFEVGEGIEISDRRGLVVILVAVEVDSLIFSRLFLEYVLGGDIYIAFRVGAAVRVGIFRANLTSLVRIGAVGRRNWQRMRCRGLGCTQGYFAGHRDLFYFA